MRKLVLHHVARLMGVLIHIDGIPYGWDGGSRGYAASATEVQQGGRPASPMQNQG